MKKLKTIYDDKRICINEKYYTDSIDVNKDISLYEYGILRNPKTNKTVIGLQTDDAGMYIIFAWNYISMDDIKNYLADAEEGFYNYIGSNKETEINRLDNENLSHIIHSINQYDGWFKPTC